jgi:uncharacterized protein (TIGR02058 family)
MSEMKRFIIEFGTGVDLHGGNCTKAAQKAIKDAISHCCLCGLSEVLNFDAKKDTMRLKVEIASPFPEKTDLETLRASLPGGGKNADVTVVKGGHVFQGLHVKEMGEGDQIVMVNAAITVYVSC